MTALEIRRRSHDRAASSSSTAGAASGVATGVTGAILTAASLVASGVLFVLYPAIRPFSTEQGLDGARAFGSNAWVVAHSLAIVAFVLLALGLFGLSERLRGTRGERPARAGTILGWIGIGLTLPYYGAEVFGLHAVGREVLLRNDPTLMSAVDAIRWQAGIWFILVGLVVLAAGTTLVAVAVWRSRPAARWSAVPLAVVIALFIPQFLTAQPVRVAYGVLTLVACALLARRVVRDETMD
jgi:hypothetical protein